MLDSRQETIASPLTVASCQGLSHHLMVPPEVKKCVSHKRHARHQHDISRVPPSKTRPQKRLHYDWQYCRARFSPHPITQTSTCSLRITWGGNKLIHQDKDQPPTHLLQFRHDTRWYWARPRLSFLENSLRGYHLSGNRLCVKDQERAWKVVCAGRSQWIARDRHVQ